MWQATGSLNTGRATQVALLENGQVLAAGGYNTSNSTSIYLAASNFISYPQGSGALLPACECRRFLPLRYCFRTATVLTGDEAQFDNPGTATWVGTGLLPTIAGLPTQASLLNTGDASASGTRCTYSGCGHKATDYCYLYTTSTNSWSLDGKHEPATAPLCFRTAKC